MTKKKLLAMLEESKLTFNCVCENYSQNIEYILYAFSMRVEINLDILNKLKLNDLLVSNNNFERVEENLKEILVALKVWVEEHSKEQLELQEMSNKFSKGTKILISSIVIMIFATAVFSLLEIFGVFKYGNVLSIVLDSAGLISGLIFFLRDYLSDKKRQSRMEKTESDISRKTASYSPHVTAGNYGQAAGRDIINK